MASEASAPVHPVSVRGAACALSFHLVLVWCVVVARQRPRPVCGLEAPALSLVHSPVLARHPLCRCLGMTGDRPSPQPRIPRVVEPLKGACAADVGIGRTPANALRIAGVDQRLLRRVSLAVDRLSQGLDMPLHRCGAGGDARCAAMHTSAASFARRGSPHRGWSELNAEQVATRRPLRHVQRLGDPCCAGLQRSSPLTEPLGHHRLTALHDGPLRMEDDEVSGLAHDSGRLAAATPTAGTRLAQEGFQTMEGDTGESRGEMPPVPRPWVGRHYRALVTHTGCEPCLELTAPAGAGVDCGAAGCWSNPVEACFEVSIQDLCGLRANGCAHRCEGLLTGATRSTARAVRGQACLPCGCERACDHCLASAVREGGHAQGPALRRAGCGYPDPSHGGGGARQGESPGPRASWWWSERLAPLHPRGLLALLVLGDLPDRAELRRPGVPQHALELTDCLDLITTGGAGHARLQLAHLPRDGLPGQRVPSLQRCWRRRVHRMCTATGTFPVHVAGSLSAYLVACPRALASETIPFLTSRWLTPPPCGGRESQGGGTPLLGAVCRGTEGLPVRRETCGMPREHAKQWPAFLHGRFGPSR